MAATVTDSRYRILLADDEAGVRLGMRSFLEAHGYEVEDVDSCRSVEAAFRSGGRPDLAILDYALPDGNALDLLPRLKAIDAGVPILILTGHGSIDLAVRAIKEGAEQFFTKPVELPALAVVVARLLENQQRRKREVAARFREARDRVDPFLGEADAIRRLEEEAHRVALADRPALVLGETGSGKGVLASWLHQNGPRADEPFVDVNCAGLSRELLDTELFGHERGAFTGAAATKVGLIEVAHHGTMFLDEIGDMEPEVQPKLLKVLEEKRLRRVGDVRDRRVDVRLVAATHQDLGALVQQKRFRSDLYFRISTLPLRIPPLRERRADVPLIAQHLLDGLASELGRGTIDLTRPAAEALQSYSWPGNVRELRNVLERAVLLKDRGPVGAEDLRFDVALVPVAAASTRLTLEQAERQFIAQVLEEELGKVDVVAQRLDVPRSSLYDKIKKYGLKASKA